jgi:flagellin-like protein
VSSQPPATETTRGNGPVITLLLLVLAAFVAVGYFAFFTAPNR